MSLISVHGGLDAPVERFIELSRRKALAADAAGMPKIAVTGADLATVYRIADGTLSPLTGPMTEACWDRVLNERVVESRGGRYAWTIPVALPVTDEEAARLKLGAPAALVGPDGQVIGVLSVASVYGWDKARFIERVYGTSRSDHPGGAMALDDPRTRLVGGELQALRPKPHPVYGHQVLSPRMTRARIADRGWERALAFQTRNPLHRAHEYALVHGLEQLTRRGFFAGAVLNPLVGQLKGDDVDAETRMRTYQRLEEEGGLGRGDVDRSLWDRVGYAIHEVFAVVGLDLKMFYAGPAEAVMHGIYRQNHGFTDIVVGRRHADAPFSDGSPIWGELDAQEIFEDLPGRLDIHPMKVGPAAWFESLGRVDLVERHPDEEPYQISGSRVRAMLRAGERPPERIMRTSTAEILIEAYRRRA